MYRDANQREFARRLRREMTDAERALWQALRCEQLQGFKFRRQAAIGKYVVDFVCFEEKIVIELDGGQHNDAEARRYDETRTRWLEQQGFRVLRYWNHDVLDDVDAVIEAVWIAMGKPVRGPPPSPALPTRGRERSGTESVEMPTLIPSPSVIESAGNKPKRIEEFVGRVNTRDEGVSVARMVSPGGWVEPGQRPAFREITVVLRGELRVEHQRGELVVAAGQAVVSEPGEWVRYSTPGDEGAEYVAVCLPAFSPDTVHRDAE